MVGDSRSLRPIIQRAVWGTCAGVLLSASLVGWGNPSASAAACAAANSAGRAPRSPSTQPAKTKEQKKAEETARVMAFFRIAQPDLYEQAKTLQKCDPNKFDHMIHHAAGTVNRLEDLKRKNRPLFDMKMKDFELEYNTLRLGKEIRRPDISPSDRDEKIRELGDLVAAQFELRQKIRQAQIDDIQKQVAGLEKQLQDRAAQKDDLIKKRINDLIESVPQLEW